MGFVLLIGCLSLGACAALVTMRLPSILTAQAAIARSSGDHRNWGHLASMPGVGAPNPKFSRVEMVAIVLNCNLPDSPLSIQELWVIYPVL